MESKLQVLGPTRPLRSLGWLSLPTMMTWGIVKRSKFLEPSLWKQLLSKTTLFINNLSINFYQERWKLKKNPLLLEHTIQWNSGFARNCNKNCNLREYLWLPKGVENLCSHSKACTPMFIAALLMIARTRKQPRCDSVGECIHELKQKQNKSTNC